MLPLALEQHYTTEGQNFLALTSAPVNICIVSWLFVQLWTTLPKLNCFNLYCIYQWYSSNEMLHSLTHIPQCIHENIWFTDTVIFTNIRMRVRSVSTTYLLCILGSLGIQEFLSSPAVYSILQIAVLIMFICVQCDTLPSWDVYTCQLSRNNLTRQWLVASHRRRNKTAESVQSVFTCMNEEKAHLVLQQVCSILSVMMVWPINILELQHSHIQHDCVRCRISSRNGWYG